MKLEVGVHLESVDGVDSLVDDGNASLQGSVDAEESRVFRVEDAVGDLDRRRYRRRHHALDRLGVSRRNAAAVARTVNIRRKNAVRVSNEIMLELGRVFFCFFCFRDIVHYILSFL